MALIMLVRARLKIPMVEYVHPFRISGVGIFRSISFTVEFNPLSSSLRWRSEMNAAARKFSRWNLPEPFQPLECTVCSMTNKKQQRESKSDDPQLLRTLRLST